MVLAAVAWTITRVTTASIEMIAMAVATAIMPVATISMIAIEIEDQREYEKVLKRMDSF